MILKPSYLFHGFKGHEKLLWIEKPEYNILRWEQNALQPSNPTKLLNFGIISGY